MSNWHEGIPYPAVAQLTSGSEWPDTPPTADELQLPEPESGIPERVLLGLRVVVGAGIAVGLAVLLRDHGPWGLIAPTAAVALTATGVVMTRRFHADVYRDLRVAADTDPVTREKWAASVPSGPYPATVVDRRTSTCPEDGRVDQFAVLVALTDGTVLPARWRADHKRNGPILQTQVPVVGGDARVWFLRGTDIRVVEVPDPTGESLPPPGNHR